MIINNDIYDLYFYFACERQNIFYKKLNGESEPWTKDVILQNYKFCNAYRASDRVSQYLIKNVIYNGNKYSNKDIIFRIILFKIFNKESTWEILVKNFGDIKYNSFNRRKFSKVLLNEINDGNAIYNNAYISCANKVYGYDKKHDNHLKLIEIMFGKDNIDEKIIKSKNMEEAFNILKSYPLLGNFMAYQLVTDINYSEVVNFTENEFTVVGPGSLRGIKKCFISKGNLSNEDIIRYVYENQEYEFKRLNLKFKKIGDRKLQLIDCQNLFCELDKYLREKRPDLKSNRSKIKMKYVSKKNIINYKYPPKWNVDLN